MRIRLRKSLFWQNFRDELFRGGNRNFKLKLVDKESHIFNESFLSFASQLGGRQNIVKQDLLVDLLIEAFEEVDLSEGGNIFVVESDLVWLLGEEVDDLAVSRQITQQVAELQNTEERVALGK